MEELTESRFENLSRLTVAIVLRKLVSLNICKGLLAEVLKTVVQNSFSV